MEQNVSNSHSANHEISHVLWNWKVHYAVYRHLPLGPVLNQMNSVHPVSIRPILKLTLHLCLCPKCFLPFRFSRESKYALLSAHAGYLCMQSDALWFDHANHMCWRTQILKLITVHFSPSKFLFPPRLPLYPSPFISCTPMFFTLLQSRHAPRFMWCGQVWQNLGCMWAAWKLIRNEEWRSMYKIICIIVPFVFFYTSFAIKISWC